MLDPTVKRCSRCQQSKPREEFPFSRRQGRADQKSSYCRICHSEYRRARASTVSVDRKICTVCGTEKPASAFGRNRSNKDGIGAYCSACHTEKYAPDGYARRRARRLTPAGWAKQAIWRATKNAKALNIPFDLTVEDIVIPFLCPVLGVALEISEHALASNSPTLDRRIPELGYVRGNVAVISWAANKIKGEHSDPTLFERVAAYLRSIHQVT